VGGVGGDGEGAASSPRVHFRAPQFTPRPSAPIEPPLPLPATRAVQMWERTAAARAATGNKSPGEAPLPKSTVKIQSEAERQSRRARRRPPPKSLLADTDEAEGTPPDVTDAVAGVAGERGGQLASSVARVEEQEPPPVLDTYVLLMEGSCPGRGRS
jgi:hypothetical protein